jgi:hypothetical protein
MDESGLRRTSGQKTDHEFLHNMAFLEHVYISIGTGVLGLLTQIVHIMAYIDFLSTFLSTILKSTQTKHVKLSHSLFSHAFT